MHTSHSAYVATSTESDGVFQDQWILLSKFYVNSKKVSKKFLHHPPSVKGDFSLLIEDDGGTFCLFFLEST